MKISLKNVDIQLFVVSVAVFAYGLKHVAALHGDDGELAVCEGDFASAGRRRCDMHHAVAWLLVGAGVVGILGSAGLNVFREANKAL